MTIARTVLHKPSRDQPPPVLDGIYVGAFPRSARDEPFADWIRRHTVISNSADWYGVHIQFGRTTINIGDIASGPVKSIIDCLYPIIGGAAGAPEDWRVSVLQVEKNDEVFPAGVVRVIVDAIEVAHPTPVL